MLRHVHLLGILETLWGGLAMIVGLSMLLLAVGALATLVDPLGTAVEFAAGLTAAVFALIGIFALTDQMFDLAVLAAVLTVIGYSVNDTIVVFDRIRTNVKRMRKEPMEEVIDASINQTLSRTIITSGGTLLATLALYLFGGEVLRGFAIALLIGVLEGTYSSIFVASPLVLGWDRLAGRRRASA